MNYSEGFEENDPVTFWTNGGKGEYQVNFKGLTSERAHSGKKSFKLDITFLRDGTFSYWAGPTSPRTLTTRIFHGLILTSGWKKFVKYFVRHSVTELPMICFMKLRNGGCRSAWCRI